MSSWYLESSSPRQGELIQVVALGSLGSNSFPFLPPSPMILVLLLQTVHPPYNSYQQPNFGSWSLPTTGLATKRIVYMEVPTPQISSLSRHALGRCSRNYYYYYYYVWWFSSEKSHMLPLHCLDMDALRPNSLLRVTSCYHLESSIISNPIS